MNRKYSWKVVPGQYAEFDASDLEPVVFCDRQRHRLINCISLRNHARIRLSAAVEANTLIVRAVGCPTLQDILLYLGTEDDNLRWQAAVCTQRPFWLYRDGNFVIAIVEYRPNTAIRKTMALADKIVGILDTVLQRDDMVGDSRLLYARLNELKAWNSTDTPPGILFGVRQMCRWFELRRWWIAVCVRGQ